METCKTLRIIVIVAVSTLVTFLTFVDSKCVPLSDSSVARSLLPVFPPSELESPSPAPAPEVMKSTTVPANPPTELDIDSLEASPEAPDSSISLANPPTEVDIDSPAASPEAPADSTSPANPPAEIDTDSPAASQEAPADSTSPTNPPAEIDTDSPAASQEAPADSTSPTNPPAEIDTDSPAASPETPVDSSSPANSPAEIDSDSPADSISPTNLPSRENPVTPSSNAPSGTKFLSSSKNPLKQPLLSPEVKTICGKTDYPPLCESSVTPLLTSQLKPDISTVLILAIQASINATKAAMATIDKVAAAECQELYDDAVANLEDAINAVRSRDIATVNTNLSAAMTDYTTCNDGFEESGEPNPLADVSDKLTKMVSNCLAISTLIK